MQRVGMGRRGGGTAHPSLWAGGPRGLRLKIKVWGVLFAMMCLMMCVPGLHAQTTASLSGTITDPTGAVIPGAQITLTDTVTGAQRKTTSNGAGAFTMTALLPGTYDLAVDAKGFQSYVQRGIVLNAGSMAGLCR